MTLGDFTHILKMQEDNMRIIRPQSSYETKIYEDKKEHMLYASLLIRDGNGHYTKSAYRINESECKIKYLGFQTNDDNNKVYPYSKTKKEELQAALWSTWMYGWSL